MKNDLIKRQDAIDACRSVADDINSPTDQQIGAEYCFDLINEIPSAEPDNQVHLCDSCHYGYPECPAKKNEVIFGNGKGHDNICACAKYMPSAEPEMKWIPVTEALPIDGSLVIACSPYGGITIVNFKKGISQEDRTKMKNGEIDDPSEETWCLSEGYSKSKRSDLFRAEDEWGNNQKAYAWQYGPFHYSGQDFEAWMPLPEPWRGER